MALTIWLSAEVVRLCENKGADKRSHCTQQARTSGIHPERDVSSQLYVVLAASLHPPFPPRTTFSPSCLLFCPLRQAELLLIHAVIQTCWPGFVPPEVPCPAIGSSRHHSTATQVIQSLHPLMGCKRVMLTTACRYCWERIAILEAEVQ